MTKSQPKTKNLGVRAAGRALDVSHSYLLRLAKDGRLPRSADGTFDVEKCRRILASITDPSQIREDRPQRWSQPGHRVTSDHGAPQFEEIPTDPVPDPTDYRERADLLDDFTRGALFGAHVVAWTVPQLAACRLRGAGVPHDEALVAHREEQELAFLLMAHVCEALGLISEDAESEEAIPYAPKLFAGLGQP